jgi:hypothetical protein
MQEQPETEHETQQAREGQREPASGAVGQAVVKQPPREQPKKGYFSKAENWVSLFTLMFVGADIFGEAHWTDFCRYTLVSGAISDCPTTTRYIESVAQSAPKSRKAAHPSQHATSVKYGIIALSRNKIKICYAAHLVFAVEELENYAAGSLLA